MIKINAVGKYILVRQLPSDNLSPGGIILNDSASKDVKDYKNWLAEVITMGNESSQTTDIKVGDKVMMDPTFQPVMFDDPNEKTSDKLLYAFVRPDQILSTIEIIN